jgi:hypothetical protein
MCKLQEEKNKQTIYIPSDTAFSSCNKENSNKENKYVEVWCNLWQKWKKADRSEKNTIPLTLLSGPTLVQGWKHVVNNTDLEIGHRLLAW